MKATALLRCEEYEVGKLKETILKGMEYALFDPQSMRMARVALKPNLLMPLKADRAVVTHPLFFRTVAEIVRDYGGRPVIIESPSIHPLEYTLRKTGYAEIVHELGIDVADMKKAAEIHYGDSRMFKTITVAEELLGVDILINLPKFKTHGYTYVTGAVKNLFGLIPGLEKSRMHMRLPRQEDFAVFLLDLYGALLERFAGTGTMLHVMDAVLAMEGEGPGPSGTPRKMNSVIVGSDALAVDYAAVLISGLDMDRVIILKEGYSRPFGINGGDEVKLLGTPAGELCLFDFVPSRNSLLSHAVRWPLTSKNFKRWFTEKPVPGSDKCSLCYGCEKICPARAISRAKGQEKVPVYDYGSCIRCFCCMEICPEAAIAVKKGSLQWILGK